jgi:hypothetical protein
LVQDYVDRAESRGRQRSTIARYRGLLRNNITPNIGSVVIANLMADQIDKLYADLRGAGLADTSVTHAA